MGCVQELIVYAVFSLFWFAAAINSAVLAAIIADSYLYRYHYHHYEPAIAAAVTVTLLFWVFSLNREFVSAKFDLTFYITAEDRGLSVVFNFL